MQRRVFLVFLVLVSASLGRLRWQKLAIVSRVMVITLNLYLDWKSYTNILTGSQFLNFCPMVSFFFLDKMFGLFSVPPPTSHKHEFYGLTSGFTRLIMRTKYNCYEFVISLHVSFHENRTKWTVISNWKICRWGGGEEKEQNFLTKFLSNFKSLRYW